MFAGSWSMMLILLLLNGSGRDLLDCLSTQDYWQAKGVSVKVETMTLELGAIPTGQVGDITALIKQMGSDDYPTREAATQKIRAMGPQTVAQLKEHGLTSADSEVIDRARQIIDSFATSGKIKEVRRLMAIRTLGELRKPQAVPALKALLDCKDPFVAEYAQAAIAAIQGQPFARPLATAAQLKADLNMLPAGLGLVGQQRLEGHQVGLIDTIAEQAAAVQAAAAPGPAGPNGVPAPMFPAASKARMQASMSSHVIDLAEKIGNVRLDAITLGASKEIGNQAGFVVLVARGSYDPAALAGQLGHTLSPDKLDDVQFYSDASSAVIMPSGQCLILVVGPSRDALPIKELIAATKEARATFNQDADLVKLLAGVDAAKPVWVAAKIGPTYRQAGVLAPFDTVTGLGERKDGALQLTVTGKGSDAAAVKAAVDEFNKDIAAALQQMQQMQAMMPATGGVAKFLGTLKCEANGTQATLRGVLPDLALVGAMATFVVQEDVMMQARPRPAGGPGLPPANAP